MTPGESMLYQRKQENKAHGMFLLISVKFYENILVAERGYLPKGNCLSGQLHL